MLLSVIKTAGALHPADPYQQDELDRLPDGIELSCKITKSRNIGNHRRFFKFVRIAMDLQDHYYTPEKLRFALTIKAGYVDHIVSHKSGETILMPKSMAFDKMDEVEFRQVFEACKNAFWDMLNEMGTRLHEAEYQRLMDFD